jgi:parvulin-like peptidyl-prolyl isomerase
VGTGCAARLPVDASREIAFSLEVGSYSQVIATQAGYHIIKLLERDPQHPLSPDERLALQELALWNWLAQRRGQSVINLAP